MLKILFPSYGMALSAEMKAAFKHDFVQADKILLFAVIGLSVMAAFFTSW